MTFTSLPVPSDRILEETRLKIAIARQHLEALQTFGLTAAWLDQLEATANETETIATYVQQLEEQKSLTVVKDEILAQCLQWGRNLRLRMELAFKNRTPIAPENGEIAKKMNQNSSSCYPH